jgi:hypothetical protein
LESEKQDLKQNNTLLESEKQELVEENASLVEKLKKRGRRRQERRNQRMDTAPAKTNAWATNSTAPSSLGKKDSVKKQSNDPPSLASEGMSLSLVSSNADVSPSPAPSNAHVASADSPPFMYQQQQPPPFGYYNMPPDSASYAQADSGMPYPPYYPLYAPGYGYNESDHHQFHGGAHGNNNADGFVPNEQFEDSHHGEEGMSYPSVLPHVCCWLRLRLRRIAHHQQLYGEAQGNSNVDEFAQHDGQFGGNAP